jgi:predicted acetyltransferase
MARDGITYLIEPTVDLADDYAAMIAESIALEESHYPKLFAFLGIELDAPRRAIEQLQTMEGETDPRQAIVSSSTRWLVCDGTRILGEARLRHALNDALRHEGGHIGYAIRPSCRRQGHGHRILALMLEEAAARGIDPVLVTCDADNLASARIIEHNGGVLEDERISRISGKPILRYWIHLADRA